MVDSIYFYVCLFLLCFSCMVIGWTIGVDDMKKKYKKQHGSNEE